MDKLKELFGVIRRQHFWIIAPILLIVGVVGWMMANKHLTQEFEQNKVEVEGYVSQMQTVSNKRPHPNDDYHKGMNELISQRRDNVRAAWQRKWDRQEKELKWPKELPSDFLSRVETMRPIEKVDVNSQSIGSSLRRVYGNFIKDMLPRLAERIGAKWEPSSAGVRGFGRRTRQPVDRGKEMALEEEKPALVEWDGGNQALIELRFDWGANAPSTMEVLYAQEDLWVLTTLIDIIKRTNGDALIRSQAAIKAIDFIQIGKDVIPPSQQGFKVVRPTPLEGDVGVGGAGAMDMGDDPMSFGGEDEDREEGLNLEFAEDPGLEPPRRDIQMDLVKNRYYDEKYEPIGDLATLMSSVTVAKRIPVKIRLQMDQRKVNELLVECANAPLTFEVRQLRFNPSSADNDRFGDSYTGGETSSFQTQQQKVKILDDYQTFDRTVELFGIIYIFNPVNEAVLNGETVEVATGDDTAALDPAGRTGWQSVAVK